MSIQSNFPNLKPSLLLDFANTKQLDNRVTFTRSTPAVFYDGRTTAMAEQNLILYSQSFNGWTQSGASVNSDVTTAPDGTTTADQAVILATTAYHDAAIQTFACVSGLQYTFSLYVKKNVGIESVYFYTTLKGGAIAKFNLNDGSYIGYAPSDGYVSFDTTSSVSVGNGWYRVIATITANSTTSTNITIGFSTNTTNTVQPITGNGTDNFYLWGAQVEQRSSATAYTATTTQPITNYIPVLLTAGGNQPRFDCNPTTGESLGLLIEEQRTNLALYSEQFDNGVWARSITGLTPNTVISPDGTLDGDKLFESTSSGYQNIFQNVSQAATTYTYSLYVKKGENDRFVMFAGSPQALLWIDMTTWTVFNSSNVVSSSITSVGNGWYRCAMTYTNTSASTFQTGLNLVQVGTTNTVSYAGNGFNGIYVWGAQLEAGSFATSYIATTSASATRTADAASMTGANFSSWFNNAEGTLYAEASPQTQSTNSFGIASLTNLGGSANSISMYYTGGNVVDVESLVNNSVQYTYLISRGSQPTKVTHGYKVNDSNVALNGTAYTTDTVCNVPTLTALTIGTIYDTGGFPCNGTIRKIAYYPLRVTNAQLAALTS